MDLMHNQVIRIIDGKDAGTYRVILDEKRLGKTCVVRLDPPDERPPNRQGRRKAETTRHPRKKAPPPRIGTLIWLDHVTLRQLDNTKMLQALEIEQESLYLSSPPEKDRELYGKRLEIMKDFLAFATLREHILAYQSVSRLIKEAIERTGASRSTVTKLFSVLCRLGFSESSLRPRKDRCGAPGVARPCDPGGRKKAGAKTTKQRIARAYGEDLPSEQPGMNTDWRHRIMAADKAIPSPKPAMPKRCSMILGSAFIQRYKQVNGELVPIDVKLGDYPNRAQIRRVLEVDTSRLERLMAQTTKGHFLRNMRGMTGRSWQGISGPGHTWAIDSTVGDVYLRSSLNRAWVIGRPIVYIIVDVWSSAIVGFYVCLTGPSWHMAKIALFCAASDPALIADLWGYQPVLSLSPAPTMCYSIWCDRGEYLSQAARITGAELIPCFSYTPPYRPDFKGCVEVPHRIIKDKVFSFVPGAIDMRRKELELKRVKMQDAVLTIRDYTHLLYTIFTEYNLTANREHRLDAHMRATGVFPSPAGLWHWGHEMGIGFRRALPQNQLISSLLPQAPARVTRSGVMQNGLLYESEVINEKQWTTYARTLGGWDIDCSYFPGSVSRIWTPPPRDNGLLELTLSDQANASAELTSDEVLDAFVYARTNRAEQEHVRVMQALRSLEEYQSIKNRAIAATQMALDQYDGPELSASEARMLEHRYRFTQKNQPINVEDRVNKGVKERTEDMEEHFHMMQQLMSATNYSEDHHG
ncbi:hypothetical protein ACFOKJ_12290 [Vogesella amnigena]|uniref:Transposase n=1 Tax=Vogesella amnigena TaxID=1507449 RepID=A0ABV7TVV9_9NEIS